MEYAFQAEPFGKTKLREKALVSNVVYLYLTRAALVKNNEFKWIKKIFFVNYAYGNSSQKKTTSLGRPCEKNAHRFGSEVICLSHGAGHDPAEHLPH
ncbi:hypothetical protein [Pontibacter sp. HSC-14F20]|uniref:hypothetical protein n=1 Tax=Pontibacter sp. HSC-14F20 TaxID=2864136 RepID=UPI0021028817|nr:hypothetical protein [Pontibacter sp. HSC-14F20]